MSALITRKRLIGALPFVVAVLVFLPNVNDFYVSDDYDHPYLAGLGWAELRHHLFSPSLPGQFFRPLSLVSMGLDHALWGRTPALSHVTNIVMHGLSALLVAALARRISGRDATGILAGVLFAAHPIDPEAVSFLGSRFDVLATLLGLGSMVAYVKYAAGASIRWLGASTLLFLCSISSKESGLLIPLVLVAYELLCATTRRLERVAPFFAVCAVYVLYRVVVIGDVGGYTNAAGQNRHIPALTARYFSELVRFSSYGLVTPVNSAIFGARSAPIVILLAALCGIFAVFTLVRRDQWRPLLFALAFTGFALAPPSTLFNSEGLVERLEGARYLYFPSAGFCIALALAVSSVAAGRLRSALVAVQVSTYAVVALVQTLPWHHASELARSTLQTILEKCADLPGPTPTVLIEGAPDNTQGAHVWRNGLGSAVRHYHPQAPRTAFMRPVLSPDLAEEDTFDLRDYVAQEGTCFLVWNAKTEALDDRSAELRASTLGPPSASQPFQTQGEKWWTDWKIVNGEEQPGDTGVWVIETQSDDVNLLAPPIPIGAASITLEMAIDAPDAPGALGEAFWAVGDRPFASETHYRMFGVISDGQFHDYHLALPLTDTSELGQSTLRFRIDPTTFPARIRVRRVELSMHD